MHLGLGGSQLGQDAAEAQRLLAELGPHPVVAGGGRIALVEDQVDHLQHRGEAFGKFGAAGHLEGDALVGQGALGAHDALGDRRLGHQEGARDLVGRQAADQAEREGHARLGGQHRMAGGEDQAQQVVADVVVEGGVEIGRRRLRRRPRARGPAPGACARSACDGAGGRWRDAWRPPSARRRACRGCRTWATAPAPRRGRPAPAPRRGRRRGPCGRGRRSAWPARCGRRLRLRDGCRSPPWRTDHTICRSAGASWRAARQGGYAWYSPLLALAILAHGLARFLLARGLLGRKDVGREVPSVEDRAQLAFALAQHLQEAPGPVDRLVHRLHLEQGVGGNQLLGFREGAIDDGDLAALRAGHACPSRWGAGHRWRA